MRTIAGLIIISIAIGQSWQQGPPQPPMGEPFPIPPPVLPPCEDKDPNCPFWAVAPLYYCEPSSVYNEHMMQFCRKSCGICDAIANAPEVPEPVGPDGQWSPDGSWNPDGYPEVYPEVYPEEPVDPCHGIYCDAIPCKDDEVWSHDENSCCGGCVKYPTKGCAPVYKPAMRENMFIEGSTCKTKTPMITSACFGVCGTSIINIDGSLYKECSCCDADKKRKGVVKLECWPEETPTNPIPSMYEKEYSYEIIDTCSCSKNACPDDWLYPPPKDDVLDNYYDVKNVVTAFNKH